MLPTFLGQMIKLQILLSQHFIIVLCYFQLLSQLVVLLPALAQLYLGCLMVLLGDGNLFLQTVTQYLEFGIVLVHLLVPPLNIFILLIQLKTLVVEIINYMLGRRILPLALVVKQLLNLLFQSGFDLLQIVPFLF